MLMENSHKHKTSKDNEATLGIYYILGQRRKRGFLDFTSKNGQFTGIEEELSTLGQKVLARWLGNNGALAVSS